MTNVSTTASNDIHWADSARQQAFAAWLAAVAPAHGLQPETVRSASADASFRRYFRVDAVQGGAKGSFIIMDAPPDKEDCRPFVAVDRLLDAGGVNVPHILAWDEPQGFMLLSDLGEHTFLSTLEATDYEHAPASANRARYLAAIDELVRLQGVAQGEGAQAVPPYDDALLQRELDLFPEWYFSKLRGQVLTPQQQTQLTQVFALIKAQVLSQPTVLVHRDYHSRNLMADPADPKARPGVIDFQDAVWGPASYDLVSLLRDAYVIWDEDIQLDYAVRYWEKARKAGLPLSSDFGEFWRDVEWMGLQRHLKVLGIFARLALRDGKKQYLDDIPRVWTYAHRVASRYQGLGPLAHLLEQAEAAHGGTQTQVGYTF
ncbi:MAG: phosphotransferase [Aquabacterium sp.]|uniref:aminoglycoside phosphotransferase family protein n=1 Tax=Aquabacterium sp. TaxID=1872578 RepID=UPI0025C587DB|nr:phosphotransferase [Aquabacterium sp.]MBI5924838.1 phosphotransferase [Aquabacterium sp.]